MNDVLTLSECWRHQSFCSLQMSFSDSLALCGVWLVRMSVVLLDGVPAQHDQRRAHPNVSCLQVLVHDTFQAFQLIFHPTVSNLL